MNKKESDIVNLPVEDATYTAQYEIRTYTIKFYGIDDTLLSTQNLNSGETVVIPEVPNYYPNYVNDSFKFVEWDKPVLEIAVSDAEYYACPELSEVTFIYNGETYTHKIYSYVHMHDFHEWLSRDINMDRHKDKPYYKANTSEFTITNIKYSNKVKHAALSEYGNYYNNIDYVSLDELYIEINSKLTNDVKYKDMLTVKDGVNTVILKCGDTYYNKIVDLHNVNDLFIDNSSSDDIKKPISPTKLITPGTMRFNNDEYDYFYAPNGVIIYNPSSGIPSNALTQIRNGGQRIIIGDNIYNRVLLQDYKLNENIVETNTDDSYYTLLGDNRDWIDEENICIYDSKRIAPIGTYNIKTFVFTKKQQPDRPEHGLYPTTISYIKTAGASGINTGVYPTTSTWMEFEASNLKSSSGDVNIGISVNAEKDTWRNPSDSTDWRFFLYGGNQLFWDRGSTRSNGTIPNISHRLKIICKWDYFCVYDVTLSKIVFEKYDSGTGSIISGYPIWIEPMVSREYSGKYHIISIYEGDKLIRQYVPYVKNDVYCFLEVVSNELCYPISIGMAYTGEVTLTERRPDSEPVQIPTTTSYIRTAGAGGINTGVYPTTSTWMEFEASNLKSSNESETVNIGISVNAEQGTWDNPDDNKDWRFYIYGKYNSVFNNYSYGLYWDCGSTKLYGNYSKISNRLKITCKWDYFSVYDVTLAKSVFEKTNSHLGSTISGEPIWIEPMTDPSYSGDYHYIKIYEGDELIRHYVPHIKDGVYCFYEVLSNKFCYPISGSYTGSVTFD